MFAYISRNQRGQRRVRTSEEPLPYEHIRQFLDNNPDGWVAQSNEFGRWETIMFRHYNNVVQVDESQFHIECIYTVRDGCLILNTPTLVPIPETVPAW